MGPKRARDATHVLDRDRQLRKNPHRGPKPESTIVLPARPLLTRRRRWRNRLRLRRTSSGRSVYNYYRSYWPLAGRYVQHDPVGLDAGFNPYLYAEANPLRYTDPTGSIVPLAVAAGVGYARCVASCAAIDAAIAYLTGDGCATLAGIGGNCALGCLNPLNWVKVNKLGMLAKSASAARSGGRCCGSPSARAARPECPCWL